MESNLKKEIKESISNSEVKLQNEIDNKIDSTAEIIITGIRDDRIQIETIKQRVSNLEKAVY